MMHGAGSDFPNRLVIISQDTSMDVEQALEELKKNIRNFL